MKSISLVTKIVSIALFSIFFASCQTVPKNIPNDLEASQLIQRGQDAFAESNFKAAEVYYNAVIERFGSDPKRYVEAKYELGHLFMKTKNYAKAEAAFNEIDEIFDNAIPGSLPGAYKKLCEIERAKIQEKNNKAKAKAKK